MTKAQTVIVTNNRIISSQYNDVIWVDGDFKDVLTKVRDYIHLDYRPVSHPLPSSSRMFLSPVRSILLTKGMREDSVEVIESSMQKYDHTLGERQADWSHLEDYELIDAELFNASLEEVDYLFVERLGR